MQPFPNQPSLFTTLRSAFTAQRSVHFFTLTFVLLSVLLGTGCGEKETATPVSITLSGGNCRPSALDTPQNIQITVMGKPDKASFGAKALLPAPDIRVRLTLTEAPKEAAATISQTTPATDAGGTLDATITGLTRPGIYKVRVDLPDYPAVKPENLTILGGISISGDHQDGKTGVLLEKPITIQAESAPGVAQEGVRFAFDLRRAPAGSRLLENQATTGTDGTAKIEIKLGKEQGQGILGIRVLSAPWFGAGNLPDLRASFFVIDYWKLLIVVAGGLAIFIFGMREMSEGLTLAASNRMRDLLHFLTRNRFAAVGMGTLVTGVIQSSSACSVMVIGFVNAGLMRLEQALGVIMGANIGTTVTAQLLSFKLGALALPAIAIGVIIALAAKRHGLKCFARILIGFGLLFFGMQMMAEPMNELRDSASVQNFFNGLSCAPGVDGIIPPFNFLKAVLAGVLITLIIQSSSATVGLLLTVAGAGLIDIYTAFGILMGDNIGTTITAVLASIGSSKNSKRVACGHVTFNVSGTIVMLILLYIPYNGHPVFMQLIADFTPGDSFAGENLPRFLANAHTGFNVFCTCVFIWLVTPLAWLTRLIVPGTDKHEEEEALERALEPHLLATPALAINQAWREIGSMLGKGKSAILAGVGAIFAPKPGEAERTAEGVKQLEKDLDGRQSAVTEYLSQLTLEALTLEQSALLPRLLHSVNDAERIGDHAVQLLRLSRRSQKRAIAFSPEAQAEIEAMQVSLGQLFEIGRQILCPDTEREPATPAMLREQLGKAEIVAKTIKKQAADFRKAHVLRHEQSVGTIHADVVYLEALQSLNRVGGHVLNIIEAACPDDPARSATRA